MSRSTVTEATLEVVAASHVGLERTVQQDSVSISGWSSQDPSGSVRHCRSLDAYPTVALADGLGGHVAGELASRIAVDVATDPGDGEPLSDLIARAHVRVKEEAARTGNTSMGATLAMVGLRENGIQLANVGDSRIYETTSELFPLSVDDSPEGERSSVVSQAIGIGQEVFPHLDVLPIETGVQFMLCSDGLTRFVDEADIAEVIATESDPADRVVRLMAAALEAGAPDNVSIMLVDVVVRNECRDAEATSDDEGDSSIGTSADFDPRTDAGESTEQELG
jgi:protein phosphatase